MIRGPREKTGLANPPRKAYSNMSEAVNHIVVGAQPVISFVEVVPDPRSLIPDPRFPGNHSPRLERTMSFWLSIIHICSSLYKRAPV